MDKPQLRLRSFGAGLGIITAYIMLAGQFTDSSIIVMLADVISGLSVIAVAVLLFPFLKSGGKGVSWLYLGLKSVEGVLMIIAGTLFLFSSTSGSRDMIYNTVHLYVFIISALLLYVLVYKTRIIHRFIAVWGMLAVAFLALSAVLDLLHAKPEFLDYFLLLIITNEFFMAGWLMIKGVDSSALTKV